MKKLSKLQILTTIFGLGGMGLFIWIVAHSNPAAILAMFVAAGWRVCVVVAYHGVPLFFDAVAWYLLFPGPGRPRLLQLYWMRWIGESASNMLPSLQIGGDLVRARMVVIHGAARTSAAAASVLVDITLSIFTQTLFTVAGLSLLLSEAHRFSAARVVAGTMGTLLALAAFYALQRIGIFGFIGSLVSKMAGKKEWQSLAQKGQEMDDATRTLYDRPRLLGASALATLTSWVLGIGEVLLSLWALGWPVTFSTAFIYESVGQAVEAGMFFVPGALGLQEGAFIGVGKLLGLPVEVALALALIRRVRELSFGIPGLIAWQIIEVRRAWRVRGHQAAAEVKETAEA